MNTPTLLSAMTCAVLAAFSSTGAGAAEPPGATAPEAIPRCLGDTTLNTCKTEGGKTKCHVYVVDRGAQPPLVFPFTLKIPGPAAGPVKVIWHLSGASFRDTSNDGPDFLANQTEFTEAKPTDAEGEVVLTNSSHFRLKFSNKHVKDYKYNIKYRTSTGREMTCDPKIHNSGA